jgi:hypothetical protein
MPEQWLVINWDKLVPRQRSILLAQVPATSQQVRSYLCGLHWNQLPPETKEALAVVPWRATLLAHHAWEDRFNADTNKSN